MSDPADYAMDAEQDRREDEKRRQRAEVEPKGGIDRALVERLRAAQDDISEADSAIIRRLASADIRATTEGRHMGYQRVMPRDLFNEGNLLKCLGQLYLELERLNMPDLTLAHDGGAFEVEQDESDGSLSVANVAVLFQAQPLGKLVRPLNSRAPFPLWIRTDDDDRPLFDDSGRLDVAALLQGVTQ